MDYFNQIIKGPQTLIARFHNFWLLYSQKRRLRGYIQSNSIVNYPENLNIESGSSSNDRCWFNARFGIYIGKNTLIGPNVLIHTVDHVIKSFIVEQNLIRKNRIEGKKVVIGSDVWIGGNVTILKGSVIPDKCVIGAGTIITEKNSRKLKPGDIVINDIKLRKLGNRKNYNDH